MATLEPLLNADEERALALSAHDGSREALHELISRHEPLVRSIANRYRNTAVGRDDLIHEGFLGLLDAAARFDPERGTRFATYARWWVRHYVQRYLQLNRRVVAPSQARNMRRLRRRLRETARRCATDRGEATVEELADALSVSVREVQEAQAELSGVDLSVDDPSGAGRLLSEEEASPEEQVAGRERERLLRSILDFALNALDERERLVIRERLLCDSPRPLREVGARLGVSRERVRQIQAAALVKMRSALDHRETTSGLARQLLAA